MTFTLRTLSCFVAGAGILLCTSTSIAANRRAPSAQSVGLAELDLQVLLDRADFSPGQIDGMSGKNSREALAAFQAAHGLPPGGRSRRALLQALGAGTVKPIVSYTITAGDVAGPFNKTIPGDASEQSKLAGLYYTSVLEELDGKFHSAAALLKRLNPRARFIEGEHIRVPNVLRAELVEPDVEQAAVVSGKSAPTAGQNGKPATARVGPSSWSSRKKHRS
jgi:peptidoglycan hydrolase-like protein with peptidoglycan-binding domain